MQNDEDIFIICRKTIGKTSCCSGAETGRFIGKDDFSSVAYGTDKNKRLTKGQNGGMI